MPNGSNTGKKPVTKINPNAPNPLGILPSKKHK